LNLQIYDQPESVFSVGFDALITLFHLCYLSSVTLVILG